MGKIIDHTHPVYQRIRRAANADARLNGAYFYSVELVKNIIPHVRTSRNWVTVNLPGYCADDSVVFIHNNKHPENYRWLKKYKNLVLVCGVKDTMPEVAKYGAHTIYLPLTIDISEVTKYRRPKTKNTAYVGRSSKARNLPLPQNIDYLSSLPREVLLARMAEYKNVYAVGRCAIEAKALGCEVLPYDPRFPDPSIWQVLDNWEAVAMLQTALDEVDGDD